MSEQKMQKEEDFTRVDLGQPRRIEPIGSTAFDNEMRDGDSEDIELRYCICADPEHCAEPVPGYVCKRGLCKTCNCKVPNYRPLTETEPTR